jgi:hypothetical protein
MDTNFRHTDTCSSLIWLRKNRRVPPEALEATRLKTKTDAVRLRFLLNELLIVSSYLFTEVPMNAFIQNCDSRLRAAQAINLSAIPAR